jgi:hypothetical protein
MLVIDIHNDKYNSSQRSSKVVEAVKLAQENCTELFQDQYDIP